MGVSPSKRTGLHTTDVQTNILHFSLGILGMTDCFQEYLAIAETRNIEDFGTLINFSPETLFDCLLGIT